MSSSSSIVEEEERQGFAKLSLPQHERIVTSWHSSDTESSTTTTETRAKGGRITRVIDLSDAIRIQVPANKLRGSSTYYTYNTSTASPTNSVTSSSSGSQTSSSPSVSSTSSATSYGTSAVTVTATYPTKSPTLFPTMSPTTKNPTVSPTTGSPTTSPTTASPTMSPTMQPTTLSPTMSPTMTPSLTPTMTPTSTAIIDSSSSSTTSSATSSANMTNINESFSLVSSAFENIKVMHYTLFLTALLLGWLLYLILPRGLRQFFCNAYPKRYARSTNNRQRMIKINYNRSSPRKPQSHLEHQHKDAQNYHRAFLYAANREDGRPGELRGYNPSSATSSFSFTPSTTITSASLQTGLQYLHSEANTDKLSDSSPSKNEAQMYQEAMLTRRQLLQRRSESGIRAARKEYLSHSSADTTAMDTSTSSSFRTPPMHRKHSHPYQQVIDSGGNTAEEMKTIRNRRRRNDNPSFDLVSGVSGISGIPPIDETHDLALGVEYKYLPHDREEEEITFVPANDAVSTAESNSNAMTSTYVSLKPPSMAGSSNAGYSNASTYQSSVLSTPVQPREPSPKHPDASNNHTPPTQIVIASTLTSLRDPGIRLSAHGTQCESRRVWIRLDSTRYMLIWRTENPNSSSSSSLSSSPTKNKPRKPILGQPHEIALRDILYVDVGKNTAALKQITNSVVNADLCFSLLTRNGSLDLHCVTKLERDALVSCFCIILDTVSAHPLPPSSSASSNGGKSMSGVSANGGFDWRELYRTVMTGGGSEASGTSVTTTTATGGMESKSSGMMNASSSALTIPTTLGGSSGGLHPSGGAGGVHANTSHLSHSMGGHGASVTRWSGSLASPNSASRKQVSDLGSASISGITSGITSGNTFSSSGGPGLVNFETSRSVSSRTLEESTDLALETGSGGVSEVFSGIHSSATDGGAANTNTSEATSGDIFEDVESDNGVAGGRGGGKG